MIYYINESSDKSTLDKDFISKDISDIDYRIIDIKSSEAKKYYDRCSNIKNIRNKNENGWKNWCVGDIIIDNNTEDFIGYSIVFRSSWIKGKNLKDSEVYEGNMICPIEVDKKYRGYGFSNILMDRCINNYHANMGQVYSDNKKSLKMCKRVGFKKIDVNKSENNRLILAIGSYKVRDKDTMELKEYKV